MKIGEKIRYFGENKFGSLKLFSEAMNINPGNLQKYLKGDREPGASILKKLKELGCDINWLLSEEEDTGPPEVEKTVSSYQIKKLEKEKAELEEEVGRLRIFIDSATNLLSQANLLKKGKAKKKKK